jgi:hypothetical protein
MKDETKEKLIQIRVTEQEKEEIQTHAKKNGFDGISAFFLFLYRKYGKKD